MITRDAQPEWRDHWTPGWEVKSPAQGAASRSRRTPLWNSTWNANKITAEVCKRLWHDVFQIDPHLMKFRHAWARSVYPQLVVNWYQETTWKLSNATCKIWHGERFKDVTWFFLAASATFLDMKSRPTLTKAIEYQVSLKSQWTIATWEGPSHYTCRQAEG